MHTSHKVNTQATHTVHTFTHNTHRQYTTHTHTRTPVAGQARPAQAARVTEYRHLPLQPWLHDAADLPHDAADGSDTSHSPGTRLGTGGLDHMGVADARVGRRWHNSQLFVKTLGESARGDARRKL